RRSRRRGHGRRSPRRSRRARPPDRGATTRPQERPTRRSFLPHPPPRLPRIGARRSVAGPCSTIMRAVTRPAPAAAVPLVLVPALGLSQGGFSPNAWVWAGALAAWAAALGVVLSDDAGALGEAWSWLAAVGALLAWTIISATWSAHAAQSVLDARRTLCYAAVVLALVVLARPGGDRAIVLATHLAITFVVVYALVRYLLGPHNAP